MKSSFFFFVCLVGLVSLRIHFSTMKLSTMFLSQYIWPFVKLLRSGTHFCICDLVRRGHFTKIDLSLGVWGDVVEGGGVVLDGDECTGSLMEEGAEDEDDTGDVTGSGGGSKVAG